MSEAEKILEGTSDLFMRCGIKSSTMDDVARHLGISKKTLYQVVSNKEELLVMCMKHTFKNISQRLETLSRKAQDAIDELFLIDNFIVETRRKQAPNLTFEVQKYYPNVSSMLVKLNHKHIISMIMKNIERGKTEGLFLKSVNAGLIAEIYSTRLESIVHDNFEFEGYTFEQLIKDNLVYHIRGISSLAGIVRLEEKLIEQE